MRDTQKHILIAEDDPGIIEVVEIILQDAGYIPHIASSYSEVAEVLKAHPVSLIFLDILLSGENGSDIAKTLKKDPNTSQIPILLLSANMSIEQIAKETGVDGFLQKPFDLDDFLAVIKHHTS